MTYAMLLKSNKCFYSYKKNEIKYSFALKLYSYNSEHNVTTVYIFFTFEMTTTAVKIKLRKSRNES